MTKISSFIGDKKTGPALLDERLVGSLSCSDDSILRKGPCKVPVLLWRISVAGLAGRFKAEQGVAEVDVPGLAVSAAVDIVASGVPPSRKKGWPNELSLPEAVAL